MMFVTADDSASAEEKKGSATNLVSNGAEEWLKEVVTLVEAEVRWRRCSLGGSRLFQLLTFIN